MKSGVIPKLTECSAKGVPLVGLCCADQAAVIEQIRAADLGEWRPSILRHDIVRGLVALNDRGAEVLESLLEGQQADMISGNPVEALILLSKLPGDAAGLILVCNAHRVLRGNNNDVNPGFVQALDNVRDLFASQGHMLVLLAPSFDLPEELVNSIILIDDPLPDRETLKRIVTEILESADLINKVTEADIEKSADALSGLSAFAASQSAALSLNGSGINIQRCWERKRKQIEQTKGLSVVTGGPKFADIAGIESVLAFTSDIVNGPCRPSLVVWLDEIEKAIAGAQSDSSGTSQDQMGVILTTMEQRISQYGDGGLICVGPPGCAKSMYAQAVGAECGIETIRLDLGAMKGSLVGQSESQIRAAMATIQAVAGGKPILWIATCNKIEALSPELRRRFRFGIWYFDLPDEAEREAIWELYGNKYNVSGGWDNIEGWSGANIRDCCYVAYATNQQLQEAAKRIVPALSQDPDGIDRLRSMANNRFLSASYEGVYKKAVKVKSSPAGRKFSASTMGVN